MNSAEYKVICSMANVLPRVDLEDTKNFLLTGNIPESVIVQYALAEGAIDFPEKYQGNPASTHHRVICSAEDADAIASYLFEKEAESVPASGIATTETTRLVSLVNIWHKLADSL